MTTEQTLPPSAAALTASRPHSAPVGTIMRPPCSSAIGRRNSRCWRTVQMREPADYVIRMCLFHAQARSWHARLRYAGLAAVQTWRFLLCVTDSTTRVFPALSVGSATLRNAEGGRASSTTSACACSSSGFDMQAVAPPSSFSSFEAALELEEALTAVRTRPGMPGFATSFSATGRPTAPRPATATRRRLMM